MACKSCEERRKQMKAWIEKAQANARKWAAVRSGNAEKPADVQAKPAKRKEAPAQDSGQASPASLEHGEQGMAADPGAGTGKGRVSVPGVRPAGGRKAGAR